MVGSSLAVAVLTNLALIGLVVAGGPSIIGLIACAAFALMSGLLVVAEILSLRP